MNIILRKAEAITSDRTNKKLLLLLLPVTGLTRNYLPQYTHRPRLLLLPVTGLTRSYYYYYYQWQDQQGTIYPSTHTDQGYYYYTITSDRINKELFTPVHTQIKAITITIILLPVTGPTRTIHHTTHIHQG